MATSGEPLHERDESATLKGRAKRAAAVFHQGGDPTRLALLLGMERGERNVGELCALVGQSQPAVSHHLSLLRAGRLAEVRRSGKNNFYTLTAAGRWLVAAAAAVLG